MLGICRLLACVLTLGASLPAAEDPDSTDGDEQTRQANAAERAHALRDLDAECSKLIQQLQEKGTPTAEDHVRLKELMAEVIRLKDERFERKEFWKPALEEVDAKDPSDLYFQGWLLSRDAEKLEKQEQGTASIEKFERALGLFNYIAKEHPDWKPEMVKGRIANTKDAIALLRPANK